MRFNGPDYDPATDTKRLSEQHTRIKNLMMDGRWRSLAEIADLTADPAASISAQLRHLRKRRFGSWIVERKRVGDRKSGYCVYRVLPPDAAAPQATKPRRRLPVAIAALRATQTAYSQNVCYVEKLANIIKIVDEALLEIA